MARTHVIGLLTEASDFARPRVLYPIVFNFQKEASSTNLSLTFRQTLLRLTINSLNDPIPSGP
jgi:hypothetical protein